MHIDLRQLRHFIALAEQRSFVAAAATVNLSQSAFSRSIQALEHSVGCQLVDRGRKDLAPTKQGQLLLEHARRLVSGAQQMANEISQFNGLEAGELRFGCGPAPAAGLIPGPSAASSGATPRPGCSSRWRIGRAWASACCARSSNFSSPIPGTSRPTRTT